MGTMDKESAGLPTTEASVDLTPCNPPLQRCCALETLFQISCSLHEENEPWVHGNKKPRPAQRVTYAVPSCAAAKNDCTFILATCSLVDAIRPRNLTRRYSRRRVSPTLPSGIAAEIRRAAAPGSSDSTPGAERRVTARSGRCARRAWIATKETLRCTSEEVKHLGSAEWRGR